MKRYALSLFVLFLCCCLHIQAQPFQIKLTPPQKGLLEGHLKMGHPGVTGQEIQANNQYLTLGGKPMIPVMGEVHFSRVSREQWRDYLLKMKANGINIIATYLFWIHHEEAEGQFNWKDNKDFRAFAKLCGELGLWVYPRIGPWCHGEVRNGATPDWILKKNLIGNRTNDAVYQSYVERYFQQIANQIKDLLYKDGGPIIGLQLENEYWRGKGGEAHILWLKKTVREMGLDVPLYTVTGWGNVSVPEDEVIPLFGGYPEEPWAGNVNKPSSNEVFFFDTNRDSEAIGNEQLKKDGKYVVDMTRYPYLTCELGVGNQLSGHRRPIIDQRDGLAIALVKIGSGSNLPGYYVFAGGTNPRGQFTLLQEDQHETGMWNEYPVKSYDFQAAITATGELAASYHQVKKLHYFLHEFGDKLAPYHPDFPTPSDRNKTLQFSVRSSGQQGFLFATNYIRGIPKPLQEGVRFDLRMADGSQLNFPASPINIPDSALFIYPFNFDLEGVNLRYATAQLLAHPENNQWVVFGASGISPEFCFSGKNIRSVTTTSGKVDKKNDFWTVGGMKEGIGEQITITTNDGALRTIHLLSEKEAGQSWLFEHKGKKIFFVSDANLILDGDQLQATSGRPQCHIFGLGDVSVLLPQHHTAVKENPTTGQWKSWTINCPTITLPSLQMTPVAPLADAEQLAIHVKEIHSKQQLWQKFFFKEFGLYNSASIRSAQLYLYADLPATLRINDQYVNQKTQPGVISTLDLTGYVRKGENMLQMSFPLVTSPARMAAIVEVIYHNGDRQVIVSGKDWLTLEQYVAPALWASVKGKTRLPEILAQQSLPTMEDFKQYRLAIPHNAFDGLQQLYIAIDYSGDRGHCYLNQEFIQDNLNNGTPWHINLSSYSTQLEGRDLDFIIYPLADDAKIRFDRKPGYTAGINGLSVIPEYRMTLLVK